MHISNGMHLLGRSECRAHGCLPLPAQGNVSDELRTEGEGSRGGVGVRNQKEGVGPRPFAKTLKQEQGEVRNSASNHPLQIPYS